MSDVIKPAQRAGVMKDHVRKKLSVDVSLGGEDGGAERVNEGSPRGLALFHHVSRNDVRVHNRKTEGCKPIGDGRLSCPDASDDGDTLHGTTLLSGRDIWPRGGGPERPGPLDSVATGLQGGMLSRYLLRRLIMLIGVVFVISVGAFYLIHLLPGDPAAVILGTGDSPANRARLYKQLGLNKPIIEQYWVWIKNVLRGNLGTSFITETSVWSTIKAALPIDLEMIVISQILAFAFAIPTAMRSARKPDGVVDRILGAGSFTLLSIPSFVLIVVFVLVIAIHLGVPHTGPASYVSLSADWITNLESVALPSIVLAIGSFVLYYRVLRSDLISTLQEEFITMARSKGISQRRIMWRHALRPSSVALLGTAGVNIGGLLAGGFIVQYLLAIPGLGYQLIAAIGRSDYLVVQGIVLVVSVGVIVINFAFDAAINIIDPRISRE